MANAPDPAAAPASTPARPATLPMVGPILFFRGQRETQWEVSALVVTDGKVTPADLAFEGVAPAVSPRHLSSWRNHHVWRYDFALPQAERDRFVVYGFPGAPGWTIAVPGRASALRLAFAANNGAGDEAALAHWSGGRNGCWHSLAEQHRRQPFHLLILGGNQVYADGLWESCPAIAHLATLSQAQRLERPFSRAMAEQASEFFFRLYEYTWSQSETAAVLASVPSIMLWDDRDIVAGWGSHDDAVQQSPVFRGIGQIARRACGLFQLGTTAVDPDESQWGAVVNTVTQGFVVGETGILALDLRSERTATRVLSDASWSALPHWLERFHGCRHLLLVAGVPVLFPDFGWIERIARHLPILSQFQDQFRDHWRSPAHLAEWRHLIRLLHEFSVRRRCRVTLLSGKMNLGGQAVLRGSGEIWQLMAPGIVHPPLSGFAATCLERLADVPTETVADALALSFPPFPETSRRFIHSRGWVELGFDRHRHLKVCWHAEEAPNHYHAAL